MHFVGDAARPCNDDVDFVELLNIAVFEYNGASYVKAEVFG